MDKTKIDWCDSTWNPITGCLHKCEYCYARSIAKRFGGWGYTPGMLRANAASEKTYIHPMKAYYGEAVETEHGIIAEIGDPFLTKGVRRASYPFGFTPTLHRYRLGEYKNKKGRNIFVCSMADLFGEWVPDEWIKAVFEAANKAPQHRYIYLTKNPNRYYQLGEGGSAIIPDGGVSGWFGASATTEEQAQDAWGNLNCSWISIEPIHGKFSEEFFWYDNRFTQAIEPRWSWVVIGAETGNRKGKVIPEREWIEIIVEQCRAASTPVFMKSSLAEIWEGPLIQEYPFDRRQP